MGKGIQFETHFCDKWGLHSQISFMFRYFPLLFSLYISFVASLFLCFPMCMCCVLCVRCLCMYHFMFVLSFFAYSAVSIVILYSIKRCALPFFCTNGASTEFRTCYLVYLFTCARFFSILSDIFFRTRSRFWIILLLKHTHTTYEWIYKR